MEKREKSGGKRSWVIDSKKCTGCRTCEVVCSITHSGELDLGKSRIRIVKWEEKGIDVPVVCQHCDIAVCMENCPTGALSLDDLSGSVLYRKDNCIGCKLCMLSCPCGGISLDKDGGVLKCDLCQGQTYCAQFCSAGAIAYVPDDQASERCRREAAAAFVRQTEVLDQKGS